MRDPLLVLAAIVAVATLVELVDRPRKTPRHVASRGPYGVAPAFTVDHDPEWTVVTGSVGDIREYLLDACREADAGDPEVARAAVRALVEGAGGAR
jgi:hypothetical protein